MTRKEMFDAIRLLPLEGKASQRELAAEFAEHVRHLLTDPHVAAADCARRAIEWAACQDNRIEWASMAAIAATNAVGFAGGDSSVEDAWQDERLQEYLGSRPAAMKLTKPQLRMLRESARDDGVWVCPGSGTRVARTLVRLGLAVVEEHSWGDYLIVTEAGKEQLKKYGERR
jgi:hypothetical protein